MPALTSTNKLLVFTTQITLIYSALQVSSIVVIFQFAFAEFVYISHNNNTRLFLRLFYNPVISISEVRYHEIKKESDYEWCDERYVGERWCLFFLNIAEC
jgi:hypothetical protein